MIPRSDVNTSDAICTSFLTTRPVTKLSETTLLIFPNDTEHILNYVYNNQETSFDTLVELKMMHYINLVVHTKYVDFSSNLHRRNLTPHWHSQRAPSTKSCPLPPTNLYKRKAEDGKQPIKTQYFKHDHIW